MYFLNYYLPEIDKLKFYLENKQNIQLLIKSTIWLLLETFYNKRFLTKINNFTEFTCNMLLVPIIKSIIVYLYKSSFCFAYCVA